MGRKPKLTEEDLYEDAWKMANAEPLLSERALCARLGVGSEYISEYAKRSDRIKDLKQKIAALRELAWIRHGLDLMADKASNATLYIWMTRNILGWRDKEPDADSKLPIPIPVQPVSKEVLLEAIERVRAKK